MFFDKMIKWFYSVMVTHITRNDEIQTRILLEPQNGDVVQEGVQAFLLHRKPS